MKQKIEQKNRKTKRGRTSELNETNGIQVDTEQEPFLYFWFRDLCLVNTVYIFISHLHSNLINEAQKTQKASKL